MEDSLEGVFFTSGVNFGGKAIAKALALNPTWRPMGLSNYL